MPYDRRPYRASGQREPCVCSRYVTERGVRVSQEWPQEAKRDEHEDHLRVFSDFIVTERYVWAQFSIRKRYKCSEESGSAFEAQSIRVKSNKCAPACGAFILMQSPHVW